MRRDSEYSTSLHGINEPEFMKAAGIRPEIFPEIRPSDSIIGKVTKGAAQMTGLAEGTPVACGAVDNTCMALGARGLAEGVAYTSLGSSQLDCRHFLQACCGSGNKALCICSCEERILYLCSIHFFRRKLFPLGPG